MKLLTNIGITAIACALCSAAPMPAKGPAKPQAQDGARRQGVGRYLSDATAEQLKQHPQAREKTNTKWMESMQQLLNDLADDNARLRQENEALRADAEALKRQLDIYEQERRQQKQNQGAFVLPPDALKNLQAPHGSTQVPPNWRPFQFNGATYYIIPLRHGPQAQVTPGRTDQQGAINLTPRGGGSMGWPVSPAPAAPSK